LLALIFFPKKSKNGLEEENSMPGKYGENMAPRLAVSELVLALAIYNRIVATGVRYSTKSRFLDFNSGC
jgi:hypothetical protein